MLISIQKQSKDLKLSTTQYSGQVTPPQHNSPQQQQVNNQHQTEHNSPHQQNQMQYQIQQVNVNTINYSLILNQLPTSRIWIIFLKGQATNKPPTTKASIHSSTQPATTYFPTAIHFSPTPKSTTTNSPTIPATIPHSAAATTTERRESTVSIPTATQLHSTESTAN